MAVKMSNFPPFPGAEFCEEEIISYLTELSHSGRNIYTDPTSLSAYIIVFSTEVRIEIQKRPKDWIIKAYHQGTPRFVKRANTFTDFKKLLKQAVQAMGYDLDAPPSSTRLYADKPASNKSSLVKMVSTAQLKAVFDPYFDDRALDTLRVFCNLGAKFSPVVRCLLTSKGKNKLSNTFIADVSSELKVQFDIRVCQSSKEHRRFLLLTSAESLILGCSLNSLNKNEAAHIESSKEDIEFFEAEWNAATSI
jgi:hypothetical protein